MGRIIDYSTPQRGVSLPSAQPDRITTGDEGRGLEQLGQGLMNLGLGVTDAIHKRQLQKDMTNVSVGLSEARDEFTTMIDEGIRSGNLDPQEVSNNLSEKFNKLSESVQTSQGRDQLAQQQAALRSQIMQHAVHSKSVLDGKEALSQIDQFWRSSGNALQKNPTAFKDTIAAQDVFIKNLQDNLGLSSTDAKKLALEGNNDMARSAVAGIIDINPYQAKKTLNSGIFDSYLKPEVRESLMNAAQNKIDAAVAKQQNIEGYRIKDPYKFLQEKGSTPPSLDLMDQDKIVKRVNWIQEQSKNHGYFKGEIPFMTPTEARDFSRMFDKMPSKDAAGLLQNISINMPENLYSSFSKQIFDERKGIGVAMAIAKDDITTSERIIAGKQLLADPKGKGVGSLDAPSMAKIKEVFNSYMGNSVHDANASEAFMDAAFSHYTKVMFDKNGDLSKIDEDTFVESIKSVLGPVGEVNGSNIVSFKGEDGKYIPASDLESEFNSLDPEIIKKTQKDVPRLLNKEPLDLKKTGGRFTPISVGDGLYILKRDNELLLDQAGNPYEIDMKSYIKESQKNGKSGLLNSVKDFFKRL